MVEGLINQRGDGEDARAGIEQQGDEREQSEAHRLWARRESGANQGVHSEGSSTRFPHAFSVSTTSNDEGEPRNTLQH